MVPVLAGPRAPWDPGCETGVLGRRWSAPPQDRLMKAPLIERTATRDTFCLFVVKDVRAVRRATVTCPSDPRSQRHSGRPRARIDRLNVKGRSARTVRAIRDGGRRDLYGISRRYRGPARPSYRRSQVGKFRISGLSF